MGERYAGVWTTIAPANARIEALLKQGGIAVTSVSNGQIEIEHTLQTTLLLRSEGVACPAPVLSQYEFPASQPAFESQRTTVAMMTTSPAGYVLNGIGTGKTRCTLWAFSYLKRMGLAHKLLVIAPISTLRRVWVREMLMEFPDLKYAVLYGDKAKRLKGLATDADVYIINHDGVGTIIGQLTGRADIDAIAIDELSAYRNGAAKRTGTLRTFARTRYWVWGLTGSPRPKAVTDIWGQATIVTPWTVPKYFSHFRQQLCYRAGPFKWEEKDGADERAFKALTPSVRFSLSDVKELPPKVMQYIEVPLGPDQKRIYNAMRSQAAITLAGHEITALNAGAVLSKLLQIAIGWVYNRDKQVFQLDNDERIQTIVDFVDACTRKVIVFVPFKSALAGLSKTFTTNDIEHHVVSGDTSLKDRDRFFSDFQDGGTTKALIAHPGCMAHGLTLTAADTIVWGGPVTSLETFMQANGRITRIGQTYKQLITMIGGTRVENKLYQLLGTNENLQNQLLELVEEASRADE